MEGSGSSGFSPASESVSASVSGSVSQSLSLSKTTATLNATTAAVRPLLLFFRGEAAVLRFCGFAQKQVFTLLHL